MKSIQKTGAWLCAMMLVAASAAVLSAPAYADTSTPDGLVKQVTDDVISTVKGDKEIQAGNINKINALVEQKVLPFIDFQRMTAAAVGRNWSTATPAQQKEIIDQFRTLLVYTYSGAISEVRDQTIQYLPMRSNAGDTIVDVRTQVVSPRGGEPITLNYRLAKTGDAWKIIDVNVLGVWLVENYRSSFAQEVNKGGIDGLIKSLTDKNASLANAAAAKPKS